MEFLLANGDKNLVRYMESVDIIEPVPDAFFNPLYEKLKMYYVTGGMPEAAYDDLSAFKLYLVDVGLLRHEKV